MELQALLVLCGAGVAVVAVLLLAGLFSTAGTSYEEAVAQQRKATTELLALASTKNKPKKAKKANKKLAKKEKKEMANAASTSDPDSEAPGESGGDEEPAAPPRPHVEFSPPVVVDVLCDAPPTVKIRKRGKDPKVKPILVNREDPSCVNGSSMPPSPTAAIVANHFEEIHPKDEFELLHSAQASEKVIEKKEEVIEKKESRPKSGKGKAAKAAPVAEPPAPEVARERHNSGEAPKEQRKGKEEVVPPLNAPQPSELTTEKLMKQVLAPPPTIQAPPPAPTVLAPTAPTKGKKKKPEPNVLALMGFQGNKGVLIYMKKFGKKSEESKDDEGDTAISGFKEVIAGDGGGVNVSELVRVITEAVLSRTEIQVLTDTLLNKQHDSLPQHSEWTEGPNDPLQKMKKQLAEKEKALADEVEASQALHAKLKELRTSLNAERARVAAAMRAGEEGAATARADLVAVQARLQRLLDENQTLTQEKLHLQSKLTVEGEAQTRIAQLEMHIQRSQESEAALVQQLAALQAEAAARGMEAVQARCEAGAARDTLLMTQQHATELAQQLQEANRVYAEMESQRQSAIHADQVAQQELRQLQERLSSMAELQTEVQRLTTRAQQAESDAEKAKEEADNQKQLMSEELSKAVETAAEREAELAELRQLRPAHNGLPPHNNYQHKENELAKVEGVMESLRAELTAAQRASLEHKEQVALLSEQIKHYQDKNNELRTKNWKVMEALQSAEKALQNKSASERPHPVALCEVTLKSQEATIKSQEAAIKSQEAQYAEVAAILRGACPLAAPQSTPSRAWVQTFAENVARQVREAQEAQVTREKCAPPVDDRLAELRAQNEQLQAAVDKYKTIIDDTEGVLSRLQLNVTEEEQRWAHKMAAMQQQLDEISNRDSQSQKKIAALEAELMHAKQGSNKHSFTDSERLTEESSRLWTEKQNGPLQTQLEEI